ncbi:uncharacterized protein MKK02DRAFT_41088 [Dioszegia hungarica]|uniref:UNC-45/Cro1/She4 central domain-containing protein n=1 Tax=Dioszegia hungarica TaxID=4972 RepID=A0AA38H258_9TREE|nr:uncharacterized protein MKK02DRAFT_41088 [Dioszegia hungarica]KAI9632778.1 hypothetical protein MKK02DRAFT_41088 [Dioszegia hungarica]
MPPSNTEKEIATLLLSLAGSNTHSISPSQVVLLERSLLPTSPKSERSLAYICLSKIVENASSRGDQRDTYLAEVFQPIVAPFLAEGAVEGTDERFIPLITFLTALFPLASAVCVALLTTPLSKEEEAPDALAIILELAEIDEPIQLVLAEMLVAATGTKAGRTMVLARAMPWLEGGRPIRGDGKLSGLCCAAFCKLGLWERTPAEVGYGIGSADPQADPSHTVSATELVDDMLASLARNLEYPSRVSAIIEGLAVISTRPASKRYLAGKSDFLRSLQTLLPAIPTRGGSLPVTSRGTNSSPAPIAAEPADTALCYGITTILLNLTSRKPVLSAEEEQMAKLRAMAASGKKGGGEIRTDPLDEAPEVQKRVGQLYDAGIIPALSGLVRAESLLLKQSLGKLCLNLVEDKERRLQFIREGGYKVLAEVTRKLLAAYDGTAESTSPIHTPSAEIDLLPALQVNAKLIITTPPNLLFPPPHLTTSLNALTPMYTLLTHPSATLLQTFEALMALTNLASISADVADRIVTATIIPKRTDEMWRSTGNDEVRIVGKVEEMMMEDNELVRRAATELVCNLAGCEKGFGYFSGEAEGSGKTGRVKQRLTFLLVLTDIDDLPTRLAAGGALAIVTESHTACAAILEPSSGEPSGRSAWKRLASLLEPEEIEEEGEKIALISSTPPDEGLILRAVCVLQNLLQYTVGMKGEAREREVQRIKGDGVQEALRGVVGLKVGQGVLRPVVECLQLLKKMSG